MPNKPTKEFWDEMTKKIKASNPDYTEEQINATVADIWHHKLKPKTKAKFEKIRKKREGKMNKGIEYEIVDIMKAIGEERPMHKYIRREGRYPDYKYIYKTAEGTEIEGQKPTEDYRLEHDEHVKEISEDMTRKFPKYSIDVELQGTGYGLAWKPSIRGKIKIKAQRNDLGFDADRRTKKSTTIPRLSKQETEKKIEELMYKWYGRTPVENKPVEDKPIEKSFQHYVTIEPACIHFVMPPENSGCLQEIDEVVEVVKI